MEAEEQETPEAQQAQQQIVLPRPVRRVEIRAPRGQEETEELSVMTQAEPVEAQLCLIRMLEMAR